MRTLPTFPMIGRKSLRVGIHFRLRSGSLCGLFWCLLIGLAAIIGCETRPATEPQVKGSATRPADRSADTTDSLSSPVRASVPPRFQDVAADSGVRFTYFNHAVPERLFLPEVMGGGLGWLDFDNDGWFDLLLTNGCQLPARQQTETGIVTRLFRNRGDGSFEDVSLVSHVDSQQFGQGCAVADFNSDGFSDIYLTNYGPNRMLMNNGDGSYADVTDSSKTGDSAWSTGAAWFDADSDGDEDLYVVNYLDVTFENHKPCQYNGIAGYCGPGSFEAVSDRLYLNQSDGRFVESSASLGLVGDHGKGMSVCVLDLNDDLIPEIYVANDMTANFLFTRSLATASGSSPMLAYRDVATDGGCALSGDGQVEASMGIAQSDFDGDGRIDLLLTHYFMQKNTLYRNLGRLQFHDDSYGSRIAASTMLFVGFGTTTLDYDRDGAADLFIANGHVLGPNLQPNEMTPQLLRNDGRGRFDDISATAGEFFSEKSLGRGVAAVDFDNDGDTDLGIAHLHRPMALLRNDTATGRHFVGIELRTKNRVAPVGGRVVVRAGGRQQVQAIVSGGSYLSVSDSRLLFGLGEASTVEKVTIYWPSGRVDEYPNLGSDRYWMILEGEEPLARGRQFVD